MKVLLISPLPPPVGGIATWTNDFLQYCKENGMDCSVVNSALIGKRNKDINGKRNVKDEIFRSSKIIFQLKNQIKVFAPDIVHINSSCSRFGIIRDTICLFYAKMKRKKVVFHCHCNVIDMLGKEKISHYFFSLIAKNADKVILLNNDSLNYARGLMHDNDCVLLPNFINCSVTENKSISQTIQKCVFVGHVQPQKGVREIFEVAEIFPNITFDLIGPIADEINRYELPNNVVLKGAMMHEDVLKQLKSADVFLFPSYSEGFSVALLEAMSIGLPVVATDVGANRDMIETQGGIIIAPRSVEALEKGILCLTDYETRENMSIWNINKVKNNYTVEVIGRKILSVYRSFSEE